MKKFVVRLCCLLVIPCAFAVAEDKPFRPLKVGFILTLTGPWAEFGEAQSNSLRLAREDRPQLFANLPFIIEDCGHKGSDVTAAFQKLLVVDKVNLIFVWGVEPALVLAPMAEARRIPLIVSAQAAAASIGRDYVIRTINYSEQYAQKLLEYFRTQGLKKIAMVQSEMSFHTLQIDGLKKNLRPDETLEIVDNFVPTATDFNPTILKLRRRSFDVLGVYLTPPQILEFYREAHTHGLGARSFGLQAFQSSKLTADAAGLLDGVLYVHNVVRDNFRRRYLEAYGNDHQIPWGANAYDTAMVLGELFGAVDRTPDAKAIITALSGIPPREGAGGRYRFQESAAGGKFFEYELGIFRIQGKEHVRVM